VDKSVPQTQSLALEESAGQINGLYRPWNRVARSAQARSDKRRYVNSQCNAYDLLSHGCSTMRKPRHGR
jgi:hypothetical protein